MSRSLPEWFAKATPEFIRQMTDGEYKAWVETGKFPERLRPLLRQKEAV